MISLLPAYASFLFTFVLGAYCGMMASRLGTPPADLATSKDNRPPVLYLRAFNQESDYFGGNGNGYEIINVNTFEQFFSNDISTKFGPFIALGSPEDYVPPEGAFRMYADDKDWMEHFKYFSQRSACILVGVGKSDNLKWELEWLKKNELQQKLIVITPPTPLLHSSYEYFIIKIMRKIRGTDLSWTGFADELHNMGYFLSFTNPGPGSVLTFDVENRGILLTTDAETPTDFIAPIKEWIKDRKYLRIWS
jgi:hypothetical protein